MNVQEFAQALGARIDRAQENWPWLGTAMEVFEINTNARRAAFLAQVGHESGGLKWINEIWGPTPAQARYEGREDLGNTEDGDGFKYRGRGWIQVTGRANYRRAYERLKLRFGDDVPDFEADPDKVATSRWAAMTAAGFWFNAGCNAFADQGRFERITRAINGGLNGQADRLARWDEAKEILA